MTYTASGSMIVSTGLSSDMVEASIEEAFAKELNIHPSTIEVLYDASSGTVIFTITSEDAESLVDIGETIDADEFVSILDIPDDIVIESITSPSGVIVNIDVSVDASDVDDVDSRISDISNALDDEYTVESEGNFLSILISLGPQPYFYFV